MPLQPLEVAILNLIELTAVEDRPPFLHLLRRQAGHPVGSSGQNEAALSPGKIVAKRSEDQKAMVR